MSLQFHTTVKNGSIELPLDVRRIVRNASEVLVTLEEEVVSKEESVLQGLFNAPLKANQTKPLSREEANKRG